MASVLCWSGGQTRQGCEQECCKKLEPHTQTADTHKHRVVKMVREQQEGTGAPLAGCRDLVNTVSTRDLTLTAEYLLLVQLETGSRQAMKIM